MVGAIPLTLGYDPVLDYNTNKLKRFNKGDEVLMAKKRTTLADVAKFSGVSPATVSLVYNNHPLGKRLSDETVKKVREAIAKLDYRPQQAARNLATGTTGNIGLLIPFSDELSREEPWLLEVMGGIIGVVSPHGYNFMLSISADSGSHASYQNIAQSSQVDGLILYSPELADLSIRSLEGTNLKFILCGKNPHLSQASSVDVDNIALGYEATAKFITRGHSKIAFVHASLEYQSYLERYRGYRKALEEAGLREELLLLGKNASSEAIVESISRGTTAFFLAHAAASPHVYEAAKKCGKKIPEDVSLLAADDLPVAPFLTPPLSCFRLPHRMLGECAAKNLLAKISGERQGEIQELLDFAYVERGSVAKT